MPKLFYLLLKVSVALLFLAKGMLHFTSDYSYELLASSQSWITPLFGTLLLLFGVLALLPEKRLKEGGLAYLFLLPTFIFIIQSVESFIKADYLIEQFIEHGLQMMLPVIFIYVVKSHQLNLRWIYFLMAVSVALTFIGHGLYALGWHKVPDGFVEMTSRSLRIDDDAAVQFLFIIGLLDLLFAILCFTTSLRKYALWYLIIWGFLTAIARTFYVLDEGWSNDILFVNLPNTLYRLSHGIVPVLMLMLAGKIDQKTSVKPTV